MKSWVQVNLTLDPNPITFGPFVKAYKSLEFWRNGELFLESFEFQLVLYDSMYEKIKDLGITDLWFSICILKESLTMVEEKYSNLNTSLWAF